jgi:hypothetical protein
MSQVEPNHTAEDDPELLRLGEELEKIVVSWRRQRALDAARSARFDAAVKSAGLLTDDECRQLPWSAMQEHVARLAAFEKTYDCGDEDPVDEHGNSIAWNEIDDRMSSLCSRIMKFQPHTSAGLGIQARAICLSWDHLWDDVGDDAKGMVGFIRTVCSLAGVRSLRDEAGPARH